MSIFEREAALRQREQSPVGEEFPADTAIDVVFIRLETNAEAADGSAALLSEEERQRASRFVFDRDRGRFIFARAWLRRLLAERLCVEPGSVEFAYGPRGKPALTGRLADSGLRFNVSHSDDLAVYAFSRGREIGVDVEAVRAMPDADDIAARFFSRREYESYLALDAHDRPLGFFNCWTRKEAFIKALGDGLYHPLDSFDVSLAPDESAKLLRVGSIAGENSGWMLHNFTPSPGFVGAVVVQRLACATAPRVDLERIAVRPMFAAGSDR